MMIPNASSIPLARNVRIGRATQKVDLALLLLIGVIAIPAMATVGIGYPAAGARWFFGLLLLALGYQLALKRDCRRFVALLIGVTPVLMMLRDFFFYSAVTAMFACGIIAWSFLFPEEFGELWRNLWWRMLFFVAMLYWALSYYLTGEYASNLRVMELVLAAACLHLLAGHRRMLAVALFGCCLSVLSIGIAFLPYGDRLGSAEIGGYSLGNPITFGLPLALIITLLVADDGKWLLLERHRLWRLSLGSSAGALLLLSTSRGSWAIVIANLIALFLIGGRRTQERRVALALLAAMALATILLLVSPKGEDLERAFERTASADSSWAHSSSGRTDQWRLFPRIFEDAPLFGFGPGTGPFVHEQYSLWDNSLSVHGKILQWHSLYLLIGVETGALGLSFLILFLLSLLARGIAHLRARGVIVPLLGILSFIIIGFSVSGFDASSGLFLGCGLVAAQRSESAGRTRGRLHPSSLKNDTRPHPR